MPEPTKLSDTELPIWDNVVMTVIQHGQDADHAIGEASAVMQGFRETFPPSASRYDDSSRPRRDFWVNVVMQFLHSGRDASFAVASANQIDKARA